MRSPTTKEGYARWEQLERQVRERYPNWNPNRMTRDIQEADHYFTYLLSGGDPNAFSGGEDDLPLLAVGRTTC